MTMMTEEQRRIDFCIKMLERIRDSEYPGGDLDTALALMSTSHELSCIADEFLESVRESNDMEAMCS